MLARSSQKEEYVESGQAVSAEVLQSLPSYAYAQCCMVHINYTSKHLSGLLPALSSRGGFRREGATNRGPSFFGPRLAWYTSTSATLVSFILFKLVFSVKDCFLRCKCGRENMGSYKGVQVVETLARRQKQLQSEYGHVVIMTAYSFSFSSLFGAEISSLQ